MTADDPISVDDLRRRLEYIRAHAVDTIEMSSHERGQIAGARNILDFVLTLLDRVHCQCTTGDTESLPARSGVFRLITGENTGEDTGRLTDEPPVSEGP